MLQRVCDSVPSGTKEDSPHCRRNSTDSTLLQMCSSGTLWKSRMMVQRVPPYASMVAWLCVHFVAFVCAFLLVRGWPTAVLESLLTESVGSAWYFYPLACVREQVEALWDWNKVTWWRLPLCNYLEQLWPNVKVCECPFYKDTACDVSQASAAEWKSSFPQHNSPRGEQNNSSQSWKKPPNMNEWSCLFMINNIM